MSLVFTVCSLQYANGYLVAETPLQVYHSNDLILIGKVTSLKNTGNFSETYQYDIQVEEYVKNKQSNSTVSVIGISNSIPSSPKFNVGDRVLLMLDKQDGNYVISPDSIKAIPDCTSHEMLGLWKFPYESMPQNPNLEFKIKKNCLDPLIQVDPSEDVFFSPLLQIKSGTSPEQVSCKPNLVLVIKSENNIPSCVTHDSAYRMVKQGWMPGPINKIVTDLHNVYYNDDKIDFSIDFIGFVKGCDYPHITILDSNHDIAWKGNNIAMLCDPEMNLYPVYVNQTYKLSDGLGGPITINKTGDYTMRFSFYDQILNSNFTVIDEPKYR
ncbi:MAG: hypothetical protein ABI340_08300 [Nitrososphaera sp.]|jgi:hypothetical protein